MGVLQQRRADSRRIPFPIPRKLPSANNTPVEGIAGPHPILRVPDDVLRRILLHAAPSFHYVESKRTRASPWTLSYVCRRWRHIAIFTVELWSLVCMDSEWAMGDGTVRLLELQLARSQDCKLRVHYDACEWWRRDTYRSRHYSRYLSALLLTTRRWKALTIAGAWSGADAQLMMGSPFDALEEVRWNYRVGREDDARRSLDFRDAPSLRRLVLRDENRSEMLLPWAQITTLATYSPRSADLVQCESLQNLEIDFDLGDDVETPVPSHMPSLLRLSLVDNERTRHFLHHLPNLNSPYSQISYIPRAFEHINAPLLHTLKLSHALRYPQIGDSSRITHLALIHPRTGTDSMGPATIQFLRTLPNLTMFNFAVPNSDNGAEDLYGVVKSLRVTANSILLPRLTHLRLINVIRRINLSFIPELEAEGLKDLLDIAATRANAGVSCVPLREMVLVGNGEVSFDGIKYFMRLHFPGRQIDENVKVIFTEVELDDTFQFAGGLPGKDFGVMPLL
ncbi:hypothetical protein BDZ89DRAFT_1116498 [Hymenopellis radicata]|nr:hypothetical protein BDZ89DRAFT_1116498 [Hymenopellis radicata]